MPENEELQELNLVDLFASGRYVVPIYQRNYAWQEEQIEQLILDVWDYAQNSSQQEYYIGSLVVFERTRNSDCFEVIDGQQRHTTLLILLSVLKNVFSISLPGINRANLYYDGRNRAQHTLQALLASDKPSDYEPSLFNAYEICRKYLSVTVGKGKITKFTDYLLKKVKIIRVKVPADTDLNHYFEIMNNRGEQLEKHEVLKARLMDTLNKDDTAELNAFAVTWDACSDMRRYVQYGFFKKVRSVVFGNDLNTLPNAFEEVKRAVGTGPSDEQSLSILESLNGGTPKSKQDSRLDDVFSERFNSVINFSNFLLHALRINMADCIRENGDFDIALDDKALLETFEAHKSQIDAKQFIVLLLKLRFLFDKYIIKREWDDKWSLKQIRWYENQDNINYVNTIDDDQASNQIIMLLSMLHVSFPSLIYKHWLCGVLLYLYENAQAISQQSYLEFLEAYDSRLFFGRLSSAPREYRDLIFNNPSLKYSLDLSHLDQATNTQNYIFNRLDYLVWKANAFSQNTLPINLQLDRRVLDNFSFTFRSSVEHYYPQHPIGGEKLRPSLTLPLGVDSFGNLCLISRSNNSRLSNYLPTAKKDHYAKSTTIESLKQQLMMKEDKAWGPDGIENILEHQQAVMALLQKKTEEIRGVAHA